jgi:acetolactate synthase regulatory subunit
METAKFIFTIEAEKHYNILVRIITILNRQRIPIHEFNSHIKPDGDALRISLTVDQTRESAIRLSKKLDREIDVIAVNLFEQLSLGGGGI